MMNTPEPQNPILSGETYMHHRMKPSHGDLMFLHLADLKSALEKHGSKQSLKVLDYGCGGSPYRALFPYATYHRADYQGAELDFIVDHAGALLEVPSASYDLVLSTQVLEHAADPQLHLREAHRVLKPGGKLLLSTHGTFPDHGCPHDYWRWTRDGLALELQRGGFQVEEVLRLTCGARGVLFCVDQMMHVIPPNEPLWLSIVLRAVRRVYLTVRTPLIRCVDNLTQSAAVTTEAMDWSIDLCIGLLASAQKPNPGS